MLIPIFLLYALVADLTSDLQGMVNPVKSTECTLIRLHMLLSTRQYFGVSNLLLTVVALC